MAIMARTDIASSHNDFGQSIEPFGSGSDICATYGRCWERTLRPQRTLRTNYNTTRLGRVDTPKVAKYIIQL